MDIFEKIIIELEKQKCNKTDAAEDFHYANRNCHFNEAIAIIQKEREAFLRTKKDTILSDFMSLMRDATPDEQKKVLENIKKISTPTGINFWE